MSLMRWITILLLFLLPFTAGGARRDDIYNRYVKMPSKELFFTANSKLQLNKPSNDTSLVCYTIIYNRYQDDAPVAEKQMMVETCMHLWSIYFYTYYDYPKCFEFIAKARDIAKSIQKPNPLIYLSFGAMYQTIAEESHNTPLNEKALGYYRQAFAVSQRLHDHLHMDMALTNVISVAHELMQTPSIAGEMRAYRRSNHGGLLYNYNLILYDAVSREEQGRKDAAIECYDRQIAMLGDNKQYSRLVYFTFVNKARALETMGRYRDAIAMMQKPREIAEQQNQKDLQLEVYDLLSALYNKVGDTRQYTSNREKYYQLKDTLTSYRQVASVNEMEFQQQMNTMSDEIRDISHRHAVQMTISIVASAVAAVILLLLFVVYRQNRRLRESNRQLYHQNVSMLKAEEEQRQLRRKANVTKVPEEGLVDSIVEVMENNDEIFQPGFSVERLASLVGSRYRYVSQVIHERFGCNFNTFLNEYRIKEACKRMNDTEHYGNLTIEAISSGVGFKSRTSFVTSFKRFTGLTPSEYQAQAKRENSYK